MLKAVFDRVIPADIRMRLSRAKAAYLRNDTTSPHHAAWLDEGGPIKIMEFDLSPDDFVVDIGAYRGHWVADMFTRYQCRIAAVEPVLEFADEIRAKFGPNSKIEVHPVGLGAKDRLETILVQGDASSTILGAGSPSQIEIVDVSKWLNRQNKPVALMAINCEGGEYEILPRLIETGQITQIQRLLVQFHKLDTGADDALDEIRLALSRSHQQVFCYPFVWELWVAIEDPK